MKKHYKCFMGMVECLLDAAPCIMALAFTGCVVAPFVQSIAYFGVDRTAYWLAGILFWAALGFTVIWGTMAIIAFLCDAVPRMIKEVRSFSEVLRKCLKCREDI